MFQDRWDGIKEGAFFKKEDAVITQLNDGVGKILKEEDERSLLHPNQNFTTRTDLAYETTFVIQTGLGCFKNTQNFEVLLFPNPTSTDFFIQVKSHEIIIKSVALLDIDGRVIAQSDIEGFKDYNFKIGTKVSNGIYLVKIQTNAGTFYNRLLVNQGL